MPDAQTQQGDSADIKFNTPFGPIGIAARGYSVFVVISLMLLGGMTVYEHQGRSLEHDQIVNELKYNGCLNRLAIYIARLPKDQQVDFSNNYDLYTCAPKFVTDPTKQPGQGR